MDSNTVAENGKSNTTIAIDTFPGLANGLTQCPSHIGIVGTGDFARALATRAVANGMTVSVGSRYPEKRLANPREDILTNTNVHLVTIEECIASSDLIVIAIHPEHHATLSRLARIATDKILVDVSNSLSSGDVSNAERLAAMFPGSVVVKSLNTVSAYALSSTVLGQKAVSVCGDHPLARQIVSQFITRLGYLAVDSGPLEGARRLEESNRELFPGWGYGTITMFVIFSLWTIYAGFRYFTIRLTYTQNEKLYDWYAMFSDVMVKVFGDTAVTLLALSYIPGPIAALLQLTTGTKHRRFHRSMEKFLAMRKSLGLYALLLATIHGVLFIFVMSGAHVGSWYDHKYKMIPFNATKKIRIDLDPSLNFKGSLSGLFAAMAMVGMGVIGITSIGSVASSMNWREWQCIQSHVGFVVLFLTVLHVTIHSGPNWYKFKPNHWPLRKMTHTAFLSAFLPTFALIMKIIILLPCVYRPVQRIRKGWERGEKPVAIRKGNDCDSKHSINTPTAPKRGKSSSKVHPVPTVQTSITIQSTKL